MEKILSDLAKGWKKQHVLFCMWHVSLAMRLETVDLYAFDA